jgi:hypothetical protein
MMNTFVSFARRAALAVALAATSSLAAAGVIHVAIDTSSFGADSGFLDMQLSSLTGVPLATATISNFTGFDKAGRDDFWSAGFEETGDGYVLNNNVTNYLSHAVTYGGVLGFDLAFAGEYDPDTSYISHFAVWAYDSDINPLGNYDAETFALLEYTWTPSPTEGGQGSVGTVPEPAAWLLMGTGALGMALARRRRSGKQAS